jgi:hypothetical protein
MRFNREANFHFACASVSNPLFTLSASKMSRHFLRFLGVAAVSQRLIPTGKQSSLLTRIAMTGNVSLCVRGMKS